MLSRVAAVALLMVAAPLLRADFTMGYEVILEVPAWLTPELAKQLKEGLRTRLPEFLTVQVRGDKGFFGTQRFKVVADYSKQEVTILEPPQKRFATMPMKDYPGAVRAAMPGMPGPVQAALGTTKPKFSIRKTGRSEYILGFSADEYEAEFSVEPAGELAARYQAPIAKTVLRLWIAAPENLVQPGVSYYMDKMQWLIANMNLVVLTQLGLGSLPGAGQEFTGAIEQLTKSNALVVQAELELYAPTLWMAEQELARAAGALPVALTNVVVAKISLELGGISFDEIEDGDFTPPITFVRVTPQQILSKPVAPGK